MIRINLLPEKELKRRRTRERAAPTHQVSPLTILTIVALAVFLGGFFYNYVHKPVNEREATEAKLKTDLERVEGDIKKLEKKVAGLKATHSVTRSKLQVIYALDPEDRLLWAEKLNNVSDLMPDNVFITRMVVLETIVKKETAESIKSRQEWVEQQKAAQKGKRKKGRINLANAPPQIFYPQITQTLILTGIAFSDDPDLLIPLINGFYDNLERGENPKTKAKAQFMKGFKDNIGYGNFVPRVVGGRPVLVFSFTLATKPTGPKPSAAKAAGGT